MIKITMPLSLWREVLQALPKELVDELCTRSSEETLDRKPPASEGRYR
jgi:hypothetical protein